MLAGMFAAAMDLPVKLAASYNASDLQIDPSAASASFSLESDGDIVTVGTAGGDEGDWIAPKSAAPGDYECRATLDSGDTPSGTLGSWVALSSTRTWGLSQSGVGSKSCALTVEIRKGSGAVLVSTSVSLSVDVAS